LSAVQEEYVCLSVRSAGRRVTRVRVLLLVLAVVAFNAFGNLLLTWGLRHVSERLGANPLGYLEVMLNPFIAFGIMLLAAWLLTRMALMSWADLSFVLPVTSAGYVLSAVLGRIFLRETVSPERWLGTVLIFAGALVVGLTTARDTAGGTER
jgi:uncharacterized membrane protein